MNRSQTVEKGGYHAPLDLGSTRLK